MMSIFEMRCIHLNCSPEDLRTSFKWEDRPIGEADDSGEVIYGAAAGYDIDPEINNQLEYGRTLVAIVNVQVTHLEQCY